MMKRTICVLALASCGDNGNQADPDAGPDPDAAELTCGTGTIEEDGVCLPAARRFEIRIDETSIGANGRTKRDVLVFGTEPDGSAVRERIVIGLDRDTAGTLDAAFLTLGVHGATTRFTPCLAADDDCLGTATLTLALESAPEDIVATAAISLVGETNVSSEAPCLDQGRRFHLQHGNDIFEAEDGAWFVSNQFSNAVSLELTPITEENLARATFEFNTTQLGVPLDPGIFTDARRASSQIAGHPGMNVIANSLGCNQLTGSFQIHHYTRDTSTTTFDLLISFEQFCDSDLVPLEGCVRYTP